MSVIIHDGYTNSRKRFPYVNKITVLPVSSSLSVDLLKGLQWGSTGTATIIIRGVYVRIGTVVTMKALASVDSGLFPVVFRGVQHDDGIHAQIIIRGETAGKPPDRFCFNLVEITACDDLVCGGIGVLLYRNAYIVDCQQGGMNQFLEYQACE